MKKKTLSGINIQFPISSLILNGKKTIETRTYPIPVHYIDKEIILVETPGKAGKFKAQAVGIIKFGPSFKYKSKAEFYADSIHHCVTPDSPWAWNSKKGKWGWPVQIIEIFKIPKQLNKRVGIKYTKNIEI